MMGRQIKRMFLKWLLAALLPGLSVVVWAQEEAATDTVMLAEVESAADLLVLASPVVPLVEPLVVPLVESRAGILPSALEELLWAAGTCPVISDVLYEMCFRNPEDPACLPAN